jgi:O-antigen/teichoic acid export membrane protein
MIKRLKSSEFVTSVATLVSGTVIAQIITYSLTPIVTRLYTEEDWSYQSLYLRIISFIGVIATIRMELAFSLPNRMEHAFSLYRISMRTLGVVVGITILFALAVFIFPFENEAYNQICYLLPLGVLGLSLNGQGSNWALRHKRFKKISLSKMTQSVGNSVLSIGMSGLGFLGMIVAYVISIFLSNIFFLKDFKIAKGHMKLFKMKGRDFAVFKEYKDFPRINLPHALMDFTKELFIAFYLISNFESGILGLYDLSYRMLRLPIAIIGSSIGQVFFKKAVDLRHENKPIYPLLLKTIRTLLILSIVPFTVLLFFGDHIFGFVFGAHWSEAGFYAQIMSPWLMISFLLSPVSQVPVIINQQRGFFILGILGVVLMVFSMTLGSFIPGLDFTDTLIIVSSVQFVFLSYVMIWLLRVVRKFDYHEKTLL